MRVHLNLMALVEIFIGFFFSFEGLVIDFARVALVTSRSLGSGEHACPRAGHRAGGNFHVVGV